jgi:hypothetical protein
MRTMTKLEARHLNASELEIVALLDTPILSSNRPNSSELSHGASGRPKTGPRILALVSNVECAERWIHMAPSGRWTTAEPAKTQVLHEAMERLEAELHRREAASSTTPNQVELSQHAFELKLANQATQHPNSGRSASERMHERTGRRQ